MQIEALNFSLHTDQWLHEHGIYHSSPDVWLQICMHFAVIGLVNSKPLNTDLVLAIACNLLKQIYYFLICLSNIFLYLLLYILSPTNYYYSYCSYL
jgi:hypothetical protein